RADAPAAPSDVLVGRAEDPDFRRNTMNELTQIAGDYRSPFKTRYDNFIGGRFVAPVAGTYFDNITPITGAVVCEVARSGRAAVERALDAAHAADRKSVGEGESGDAGRGGDEQEKEVDEAE